MRLASSQEETGQRNCLLPHMKIKKAAVSTPERGPSPESDCGGILILHFPGSRMMRNQCLLLKSSRSMVCVTPELRENYLSPFTTGHLVHFMVAHLISITWHHLLWSMKSHLGLGWSIEGKVGKSGWETLHTQNSNSLMKSSYKCNWWHLWENGMCFDYLLKVQSAQQI